MGIRKDYVGEAVPQVNLHKKKVEGRASFSGSCLSKSCIKDDNSGLELGVDFSHLHFQIGFI